MKKIVAFDLKSIHLHENFEFLRKVCEKGDACLPTTGDLSAADLPESTTTLLTASLDKLKTKTDAFDAVLKIADSIPASTLAAQAAGRCQTRQGLSGWTEVRDGYGGSSESGFSKYGQSRFVFV